MVVAAFLAACDEPRFPPVKSVSELEPDERVVIGRIQYGDDDEITQWVTGKFERSWPYFSNDLWHLYYGAHRGFGEFPLGPRGGVFAVRVKKGAAFLHSIAVETTGILKPRTQWTFPVILKLPASEERCTFAGTIVLLISGTPPQGLPWYALPGYEEPSGSRSKVLVQDTYDTDRTVLADRVAGCDLKKVLAHEPSRKELDALMRAAVAAQAEEKREAEAARNVTP
jgi:hypothetical protein